MKAKQFQVMRNWFLTKQSRRLCGDVEDRRGVWTYRHNMTVLVAVSDYIGRWQVKTDTNELFLLNPAQVDKYFERDLAKIEQHLTLILNETAAKQQQQQRQD